MIHPTDIFDAVLFYGKLANTTKERAILMRQQRSSSRQYRDSRQSCDGRYNSAYWQQNPRRSRECPLTPEEQAALRRRKRRAAAIRRRRRRQRLTMAATCVAAVFLLVTFLRVLFSGPGDDGKPIDPSEPAGLGTAPILTDTKPRTGDSDAVLALKEAAQDSPKARQILANADAYPEELLFLAAKNPDALDYVLNYVNRPSKRPDIDLSAEAASDTVPLLLQWDERWGYESYGSGLIGWTGCGPTCLSMLVLYLTGDSSCDPATVAHWAEGNGFYSVGNGTSWTLMSEGCAHFGLQAEELPLSEQRMKRALDNGRPVVCAMGPGDFTSTGHYIILTGYDAGGFTVNDPNSPTRSSQHWTYDTLSGQISNIWAFSRT